MNLLAEVGVSSVFFMPESLNCFHPFVEVSFLEPNREDEKKEAVTGDVGVG